jgi:signal transduction histidine kinase
VLNPLRDAWTRTTVPLRLLELLVALALLPLVPTSRPGYPAFLSAVVLAALAWLGWVVADPLSLRRPGALAGRRAVVVTVLLAVVAGSAGFAAARSEAGWVFALAVVAGLAAGRDTGPAGAVAVLLVGTGGIELGLLAGGGFPLAAVLGYPAGLLAGVLGGLVRAGRRDQEEATRQLLRAAEQTRTEQARGAALAERARIAREVHDVLAHSLGGLAIQLEVADALLSGEPDEASRVAALQRVRTAHDLATAGLEDTRRAVHALRVDSPPLPDSLATLAAGARENGTEVTLRVEGRPRPLGAGEVALLRTAQEALVNAAKHAPGSPVRLDLTYGEEDTALVVTDGGTRDPGARRPRTVDGGFGLAGLRERLELSGGSLAAGPCERGWRVTARVPR